MLPKDSQPRNSQDPLSYLDKEVLREFPPVRRLLAEAQPLFPVWFGQAQFCPSPLERYPHKVIAFCSHDCPSRAVICVSRGKDNLLAWCDIDDQGKPQLQYERTSCLHDLCADCQDHFHP